MFSDAITCYSKGNSSIKGKKAFLYGVAVIVYLLGTSITLLQLCMPAQRKYFAEGIELISILINDPDALRSSSNTYETEEKSEGQQMVEKIRAEQALSDLRMQNNIYKGIKGIFDIVVSNIFIIGVCYIYINIIKGKGDKVSMKDIFYGFSSGNYLQKVLATFLKNLALSAAYALCLIPGLVINYYLAFIEYLMADDPKLSFTRAFEISWKATNGYKLTLLAIDIIAILPTIICIFLGVIGIKIIPIEMLLGYTAVLLVIVILINILIQPYKKAAIACVYEDAKGVAKSYGIIRGMELFDPEDYNDSDAPGGMTYFVG